MAYILVLNSGSSSVKYSLIETGQQQHLLTGLLERIGENQSQHSGHVEQQRFTKTLIIRDHAHALTLLFLHLEQQAGHVLRQLAAIAHRVVHGGERFTTATRIDAEVIATIRNLIPLAPLHNPANLLGIELAQTHLPNIPQIAVFDTAFHHTLPETAYRYAVPTAWYTQHAVRRYGFHGSSHAYVAGQAAAWLDKPLSACQLITLHLGNGASACAIAAGSSVDTSMGLTPLEGLIMGTRAGDVDTGVIFYLQRTLGWSLTEIETSLNKQSGLKGLCGNNDMRLIHQRADSGDRDAELARTLFAYRVKKYIGAYLAVLGDVDALVFTGGIGENDAWLREHCLTRLHNLGIVLDPQRNTQLTPPCSNIASRNSRIAVLVMNTDEELQIALESEHLLQAQAIE